LNGNRNMIYVSIDIETTGLDWENNDILSIAAIVEDTTKKLPLEELPKFKAIITHRELKGHPYALNMNKGIIELLSQHLSNVEVDSNGYRFLTKDEIIPEFYTFLRQHVPNKLNGYEVVDGKIVPAVSSQSKPITINVAGKNFGTFDINFLNKLPWWKKLIRTRAKILDPGVLYCDWSNDESAPSLSECKVRAGLGNVVTHDALDDAWDVIELLRKFY
jgi:oligoribonuclease